MESISEEEEEDKEETKEEAKPADNKQHLLYVFLACIKRNIGLATTMTTWFVAAVLSGVYWNDSMSLPFNMFWLSWLVSGFVHIISILLLLWRYHQHQDDDDPFCCWVLNIGTLFIFLGFSCMGIQSLYFDDGHSSSAAFQLTIFLVCASCIYLIYFSYLIFVVLICDACG
jgi:hypothetical protein